MSEENQNKKRKSYATYKKRNQEYNKKKKMSETLNSGNKKKPDQPAANQTNKPAVQSSAKRKPYRKTKQTYKTAKYHSQRRTKDNKPIVYDLCPFCSKAIKEPLSAIKDKENLKNSHFECILDEVKKIRPPEGKEKIYYLGGGGFGVVLERKVRNRTTVIIKERIEYHKVTNKRK